MNKLERTILSLKTLQEKNILLTNALKSAKDVLVMCTLIDKSDTCKKEVEKIENLLNT